MWLGVAQLPSSRFKDCCPSFRICTASLIHLVLLSDSLSKIVEASQLITWLSWDAWSVSADLFCSDRLDPRWFLVKGLLVNSYGFHLCLVFLQSSTKFPSFLSYVGNQRASSLTEQNKSAMNDHASHDNHVINWPASTILDRESDKSTRWIKQAVHIRKEGQQSLNRDEGSYTLSDTYDWFLAMSHHYCGKNRKRNWTNFFWWRSLTETETSR